MLEVGDCYTHQPGSLLAASTESPGSGFGRALQPLFYFSVSTNRMFGRGAGGIPSPRKNPGWGC